MNYLLYQAYGGENYANECRFALLRLLKVYNLQPPANLGVVVYTDQAQRFADFSTFLPNLQCVELNAATVQRWRGEADFVHRLKIEMMRDFFQRFNGNLLYCDTDTYPVAPLEELFADLENGVFFMHEYEGVLDKTRFPAFGKWEKFLSETPLTYNGKTMTFHRELKMFNAGAVGLPAAKKELLTDVLALTDSVYKEFPKHIAEQFAFSYCLQNEGAVKQAKHLVAHYWNLKEFRSLLARFFETNAEESIPNLVKKAAQLDALKMMAQKTSYKALPFWQRLWKKLRRADWKIETYEGKL